MSNDFFVRTSTPGKRDTDITLDVDDVFPAAPLQTALHLHRLSEPSGTLADLGSGAIAATLVGSGWTRGAAGPYRGRKGVSQSGAGSTDAVLVSGTTIPAAGFTVAVTVVAKARVAPTLYGPFLSVTNNTASPSLNELNVAHQNNGTIYMTMGSGSSFEGSSPGATLDWSRPHRILMDYVAATKVARLWVDGAIYVSYTHGPAAIANCTRLMALGPSLASGHGGNDFLAANDLQAWGRVLTADERAYDWSQVDGSRR